MWNKNVEKKDKDNLMQNTDFGGYFVLL